MNISSQVFHTHYSMNFNFIFMVKYGTVNGIENEIYDRFYGFRCHIVQYETDLNHVTVYYIRPVINGCQSYNGVLMSSDPNTKDMMTSTNCNLNGSVLRVAANIVSSTWLYSGNANF